MKRLFFIFSLCICLPQLAHSAPTMQAMSQKISEDFVLPAYDSFAKEAENQAALWGKTCEVGPLKDAYQKTADAWAHVQHINFGPIVLLLRRDRLYHWPERRNAVSKALNTLLSEKDESALEAERFAATSVAIQGFPALERLLYEDLIKDEFGCKVGKAIADNIASIASGTAKDWHDLMPNVLKGESHPIYFESMDEVSIRLFTELLTGFQMIADQKLALPLGTSAKKARPNKAEAWRSNRSTRYIQQNALGLMAMTEPFLSFLSEDEAKKIKIQFSLFARAANNLPLSIKDAVVDEGERAKLMKFKDEIKTTRELLITSLTTNLGLTVGFNSLDGD